MNITYPWTRYWVAREAGYSPDEGYLADPQNDYAWADPNRAQSLTELRKLPVLVLLGEAGMGKSRALRQEYDALKAALPENTHPLYRNLNSYGAGGQGQLAAELFQCEEYAAYLNGDHLTMLLDSLDEGRDHMPGLDNWLAEQLRRNVTDPERFQLRLACRTASWPASLETALGEIWRTKERGTGVAVHEICPLRRVDVAEAATLQGLDSDTFLDLTRTKEVEALASRPITLDFLFCTWHKNRTLPDSKADLYEQGIQVLCEEKERGARNLIGDARQRMVVAGRVASALLLCGHAALWLGRGGPYTPEGDIALADLVGKERGRDGDFQVSEGLLRESLNTAGLFTGFGRGRMGFAHQSFAEFLAAWYLRRTGNDPTQMLRPLRQEEGGKLVPKLGETAAWLASLIRPVLEHLLREAPALLLHVDGAALTLDDKARMVEALLVGITKQTLFSHDLPQRLLRKLAHPGLARQLRPWIVERGRSRQARDFAMDFARWCEVQALAPDLARIALKADEDYFLRIAATHAVAWIKDETALATLKPLALGQAGPDPERRLKNLALHALWPRHLTAEEFFSDPLDASGRHSIGNMDVEIHNGAFFQTLQPVHLPAALDWVRRNAETRPRASLSHGRLIDGILHKAWQWLEEPGVLDDFAATTLNLLGKFRYPFHEYGRRNSDDPLADEGKRHLLLAMLLEACPQERINALAYSEAPIARAEDLAWLLDQLKTGLSRYAHQNAVMLIGTLLRRSYQPAAIVSLILDRSGRFADQPDLILRKELAWLAHPMRLRHRKVQLLRDNWELECELMRERDDLVLLDPSPIERVRIALEDAEQGNWAFWSNLASELVLEPNSTQYSWPHHLHTQPGWLEANSEVKARIQTVALEFLRNTAPDGEKLFTSNTFTVDEMAGLFALELLSHTAPQRLDQLTAENWATWAPLIVAGYHDDTEWQRDMRRQAQQHAPHAVRQAILNQVDKQDRGENGVYFLQDYDDQWGPELVDGFLARLDNPEYKVQSRRTILEHLLRRSGPVGVERARAWLAQTEDGERRSHAAALLLTWDAQASWPLIAPLLELEPEFAKGFMGQVAHNLRWPGEGSPGPNLDEAQAADLYIWLETQFPVAQDPVHPGVSSPTAIDHIADYRRRLLEYLQMIGTWPAVHALERIAAQLPDREWLKWSCARAHAQAMDSQWQPPSWEELAQLLADPESRLIRTGEDLLLVVLESLARLQQNLRGETPLAPFLWDEASKKPKNEGRLSDFVKFHLDTDLNRKGVLINREVEIRNWPGKGRGESLDLLIQAASPTGAPVATVVVEAKGCWNTGLDSAMETQLRDQYLIDTAQRYGIYLVGWYGPSGGVKGCRRELEELRAQLENQARRLSTDTLRIHAITLDLSLPS